MAETRQATGTPIRELFDQSDRIAALEKRVEILEIAITELAMLACGHDTALGKRIGALESVQGNDRRLSDVLRGIEDRLSRIELGGEMP